MFTTCALTLAGLFGPAGPLAPPDPERLARRLADGYQMYRFDAHVLSEQAQAFERSARPEHRSGGRALGEALRTVNRDRVDARLFELAVGSRAQGLGVAELADLARINGDLNASARRARAALDPLMAARRERVRRLTLALQDELPTRVKWMRERAEPGLPRGWVVVWEAEQRADLGRAAATLSEEPLVSAADQFRRAGYDRAGAPDPLLGEQGKYHAEYLELHVWKGYRRAHEGADRLCALTAWAAWRLALHAECVRAELRGPDPVIRAAEPLVLAKGRFGTATHRIDWAQYLDDELSVALSASDPSLTVPATLKLDIDKHGSKFVYEVRAGNTAGAFTVTLTPARGRPVRLVVVVE